MKDSHDHGHNHGAGSNERSLKIALAVTTSFLIVELVGGVLTQSLALISDVAHMFTDTAALAIGLAAIRISRRSADKRRTFGYHRFDFLAAALEVWADMLGSIGVIARTTARTGPRFAKSGRSTVVDRC